MSRVLWMPAATTSKPAIDWLVWLRAVLVAGLCLGSVMAAAASEFDDALKAYNKKQYGKAFPVFRKLALAGDADAQFRLGGLYFKGHGVKQNAAEAVAWFQKAATQGHAEAQNSLGVRYEKGQGVAQDYAAAAKWYREAADQRLGLAQDNLSDLHAKGLGVARDPVLAHVWSSLAAANGESGAGRKQAALERAMTREQRAEAATHLGTMYAMGRGIRLDEKAAAGWYARAAADGYVVAQYQLAECYDRGVGVPADPRQAAAWYEKAALRGHARAQVRLGYLYDVGQGVAADSQRAHSWYQQAALQGEAVAQYNLGTMHANGRGVAQSEIEAAKWFGIVEANSDASYREAAVKSRRMVEAQLKPEQAAEAQRLAREWLRTNLR